MDRHIIHLHIPSFAVAVARACRPELRGRPVAVALPGSARSLILSASPEARREGVFKGMPLSKARKRCPELWVLPPDPEPAEKAFCALTRLASFYTPLWEPARAGHIYLDLTGTGRLWGGAKDAAERLRREIKDRLDLAGTVGVAGNKMISSIASRILPSEGILDVNHGREAAFMAPLKVYMVPGVGRVRQRILLEELQIVRVRELAALDTGSLRLIFGHEAFVIHQRALGIDLSPVHPLPARPGIYEETAFGEDENDDGRLLAALYRLVERCARRLRKRAVCPRKAGLLIRYADRMETRRELRLQRVDALEPDLCRPLEALFFKMCTRRVRVRFMRVWFEDFVPESRQMSLFPRSAAAGEKSLLLVGAMDRVRDRYGEGAVCYGRAIG